MPTKLRADHPTARHDASTDRPPTPARSERGRADRVDALESISQTLTAKIGEHKYAMWFGQSQLLIEGNQLEIATGSPYAAKWITSHFSDELRHAAQEAIGPGAVIDVRYAPELSATTRPVRTDSPRADRGRHEHDGAAVPAPPDRLAPNSGRSSSRRSTLRRLDEFVVGSSNRLAYSTAQQIIEAPDAKVAASPLFIHGECGLGKTHLLQGITQRFAELGGRRDAIRYITGEQFTNEYITALRQGKIDTFRQRMRRLDLLAIDDVHFLSDKMRTQSEFLHTLDAIDLTGARLVLASDAHPKFIKRFKQALVSRFVSGMVVQIDRPDRETRLAIVERLADARRMPLNECAVEAIASQFVGSVRELEGAVTKLYALWTVRQQDGDADADAPVGMALCEQLFREGCRPSRPVRIGTIIDVACNGLGLSRSDLLGSSRHRRVVLGRGIVALLGREMTTHSYPELARALGRRCHSTVHTAEQRMRQQMANEDVVQVADGVDRMPLRELVDQLRHEVMKTPLTN